MTLYFDKEVDTLYITTNPESIYYNLNELSPQLFERAKELLSRNNTFNEAFSCGPYVFVVAMSLDAGEGSMQAFHVRNEEASATFNYLARDHKTMHQIYMDAWRKANENYQCGILETRGFTEFEIEIGEVPVFKRTG